MLMIAQPVTAKPLLGQQEPSQEIVLAQYGLYTSCFLNALPLAQVGSIEMMHASCHDADIVKTFVHA